MASTPSLCSATCSPAGPGCRPRRPARSGAARPARRTPARVHQPSWTPGLRQSSYRRQPHSGRDLNGYRQSPLLKESPGASLSLHERAQYRASDTGSLSTRAAPTAPRRTRPILSVQVSHGVHYRNNRVDERAGKILCLVEAPTAESAADVHREAHRLVADEIFEVSEG